MYQGIFDTDFYKYTEDAVMLFTSLGINTVFENLEGFPEDWKTNSAAFIQFVRDHQTPSFLEYGEYPFVSSDEIKKALRLKQSSSVCSTRCSNAPRRRVRFRLETLQPSTWRSSAMIELDEIQHIPLTGPGAHRTLRVLIHRHAYVRASMVEARDSHRRLSGVGRCVGGGEIGGIGGVHLERTASAGSGEARLGAFRNSARAWLLALVPGDTGAATDSRTGGPPVPPPRRSLISLLDEPNTERRVLRQRARSPSWPRPRE